MAQDDLIPQNIDGKQNDLVYTKTFLTTGEAINAFGRAYKRMLNPKVWHKLCGTLSAEFVLANENGEEVHDLARVNDYYRIDIPGPGSTAGGGYDWVQVEQIEQSINNGTAEEYAGMKLRASANPAGNDNTTAHFFKEGATSTFILTRNDNKVTATYHGRNEVPNLDTGKTMDNVRNAIITSGALAGLSELQWNTLIKAFLQEEIGG